jgi:hypothetical protein
MTVVDEKAAQRFKEYGPRLKERLGREL